MDTSAIKDRSLSIGGLLQHEREIVHPEITRRASLLNGEILLCDATEQTETLCDRLRESIQRAFPEVPDPRDAQHHLSPDELFARIRKLRVWLASGPFNQELRDILSSFGCDLSMTYFDALRLRAVTSEGHKNPAAAPAYYAHRDTWFANPACQLNWWMPLFDTTREQSLGLYPGYWSQPIKNDSALFDYDEFTRAGGWQAYGGGVQAKQHHPTVQEPIKEQPQQFARPKGSLLLFAGAHLHAPIPHATGVTRFSVEFRTFHIEDLHTKRESNSDNQSKGSTAGDFLRASDFIRYQPNHR
jgi:hypothetical protein